MPKPSNERQQRLSQAVTTSRDTRQVSIEPGATGSVAELFTRHFGDVHAVVVADINTFAIAGNRVLDALEAAGVHCVEPFIFEDPHLYAEHHFVERLERSLASHSAVPIAVGAGTINDVTKLAAFRAGRQYVAVATAASMDGYTAYGASITFEGSKQTFDCPAPRVVVADLDVVSAAPAAMNASGYADLLAKITAGADWMLADALGIESIDPYAWQLVQAPLRSWLDDPDGVRSGRSEPLANLLEGLMMSGLAMQATLSSRPASGAEHQFSHLWDMQAHKHEGASPSHGFKVGVATAAVASLYEKLLAIDLPNAVDVENCIARWPTLEQMKAEIERLFDQPAIRDKALLESSTKHVSREQLRVELNRVLSGWPTLAGRLKAYLLTAEDFKQRLAAAGAPSEPEAIGISRSRLAESHRLAYHIRRRYTVLDLTVRCDLLDMLTH